MKYTEIDGERYEIKRCAECPFGVLTYNMNIYCKHPHINDDHPVWIWHEYTIPVRCPLREVME